MAFGAGTFNAAGGAVSDLFQGFGDQAQADMYRTAAGVALKQERYTEESTALQDFQTARKNFQTIGGQRADVAGAGLAQSGGALDLLRDSTEQAALSREILNRQGLITEEGYRDQATADQAMASAADQAADGAFLSAGIKAAGAVFSLF
jgi:hypothetical protein